MAISTLNRTAALLAVVAGAFVLVAIIRAVPQCLNE